MNSGQALIENVRTCRSDVKGDAQVLTARGKSTDAEHRGGPLCNSVEASVMEVERRQWLVQLESKGQPVVGGAF